MLNRFTPPDQLTCLTLPENLVTDQQVALVGKYGYQSPYGTYYVATQDASWKMTTDFMPTEDFHKLEIYRLALSPLGINHQIGGMLALLDGTAHIVTIHRTHHGFTEREREVLNTLHPHLVTSYVNALACSQARDSVAQIKSVMETAPGAYGYFNSNGTVAWMQNKAQAWLAEFFPEEGKSAEGVPLSIARLVIASSTDHSAPQQLQRMSKEASLTVCLGASALGGWLLRLDRNPLSRRPHFHPLPQFTQRKNEVLRWMVEGKRNAEIGIILNISSRTVEKHVEEILAELGVENRASAILRTMELAAQQA